MVDERDAQSEADVAADYRAEALAFRARARELHAEAQALEQTAADDTSLATSIERALRGIEPLPPSGPAPIERALRNVTPPPPAGPG